MDQIWCWSSDLTECSRSERLRFRVIRLLACSISAWLPERAIRARGFARPTLDSPPARRCLLARCHRPSLFLSLSSLIDFPTMATQLIQRVLPSLDFPILSYINGIFGPDADPNDNPVESFIRPLLESETRPVVPQDEIERVCAELQAMWYKTKGGVGAAGGAAGQNGAGEPAKLDVALDMRRQELKSKRQAVTQVVDIASVVSRDLTA